MPRAGGLQSRPCPCGSGRPTAECCGPLHLGEREAADAEALMRSRFAAFVLGEVDYLWSTLDTRHSDRTRDRDEVIRSLRETCRRVRFMGLRILDRAQPDAQGIARVLFAARVFESGRDVSFVEASDFVHNGRGWRYASGVMKRAVDVPDLAAGCSLARFDALCERG